MSLTLRHRLNGDELLNEREFQITPRGLSVLSYDELLDSTPLRESFAEAEPSFATAADGSRMLLSSKLS